MAALVKEAEDLKTKLDAHAAEVAEDEKRYKVLTDMIKAKAVEQFRDGDTKSVITGNRYMWEVRKSERSSIDKKLMEKDGILEKYTVTTPTYAIYSGEIEKED